MEILGSWCTTTTFWWPSLSRVITTDIERDTEIAPPLGSIRPFPPSSASRWAAIDCRARSASECIIAIIDCSARGMFD